VSVAKIDGMELENEDGTVDCFTYEPAVYPSLAYKLEIPEGSHVKSYGQATIRVAFGKRTLVDDLEVVPTLKRFSAKTLKIVRI
jgi:hypothetical protein